MLPFLLQSTCCLILRAGVKQPCIVLRIMCKSSCRRLRFMHGFVASAHFHESQFSRRCVMHRQVTSMHKS